MPWRQASSDRKPKRFDKPASTPQIVAMPASNRPATIKDVAALAGVAISTVSAAVNGDGRVKATTRDRILAAARKLRYQPNRAAAVLASRERRAAESTAGMPIAFLTALGSSSRANQSVGQRTLEGARLRATALGYAFEHVDIAGARSHAAVSRSLYMRGVVGIIIGRMWPVLPQHLDFDWRHFSVVYCGRDHVDEVRPHGVEHDIFESTLRLFREVQRQGYRRIGVCARCHSPRLLDDDARLGAVLAAQAQIPEGNRVPPYTGEIEASAGGDAEKMLAWAKAHQPDAVIGFNAGDYWILRDGGYHIPQDIGYADLHTHPPADDRQPDLAGLVQDQAKLGAASVDLLDQQVRYHRRGLSDAPVSLLTYSSFRPGASLPTVKGPRRSR